MTPAIMPSSEAIRQIAAVQRDPGDNVGLTVAAA